MKIFKIVLSLFTFIPALIVILSSAESLTQGLYTKSVGCVGTLIAMGLAVTYLINFSKVTDGFKVWLAFGAIIAAGLSIATLF